MRACVGIAAVVTNARDMFESFLLATTMWVSPVQPMTVVRGFDAPSSSWGAGHRGVDLSATAGTWVHAAGDGTVAFVGTIAGKEVVSIRHDTLTTTYEPVHAHVRINETVHVDDVIGVVTVAGGHCGGMVGCMHWGAKRGTTYLNPLALLGKAPIVLKPGRAGALGRR